MINKINRYDSSASPVKLESSKGKDENNEGEDGQILTYEIVSEFMGTKNKVVSVDIFLSRQCLKVMLAALRLDNLNEDAEYVKITPHTGNGEVQV